MGFYSKFIYPRIIEHLLSKPSIMLQRKQALSSVMGNILEIGFGTGLNLSCYPDHIKKITVLDTNVGMSKLAKARMESSGIKVSFKLMSAEVLPFEDEYFDCIVSTFTFCSIEHINAALVELQRVLKPGGRVIFLEHGLSPNLGISRLQNFINPFYKIFSCGCNLNRDIESIIKKSGLVINNIERFYDKHMIKLAGYLYKGVALKKVYQGSDENGFD